MYTNLFFLGGCIANGDEKLMGRFLHLAELLITLKTCKAQIQAKTALSAVQYYILTENEQEKILTHTIIESILTSNYINPSI